MKQNKGNRPRASGFVTPAAAMALGLAGVIAACGGGASQTGPGANAPKVLAKIAPERHKRLRAHLGLWGNGSNRCDEVVEGVIYRKIEGIDQCPQMMSEEETTREFGDPWGKNVLVALQKSDRWPKDFDSIVTQAGSNNPILVRNAVLLGEGSQMPQAQEHDLRFIVTWGDIKFQDVPLFFSARPPSKKGDPKVLEVIGFDKNKTRLNFYHYEGANPDSPTKTWMWAGDSHYAHGTPAEGKGCFTCHLDGGLNMKELTVPWNNWNSFFAPVDHSLIPPSDPPDLLVTQLLSKEELKGAYDFEPIVRAMNTTITNQRIAERVVTGLVFNNNLKEFLPRLFGTSTINLASSDTKASDTKAIQHLPNDFLLFDTALRDPQGINLSYGGGPLNTDHPGDLNFTLARSDYNAFVTKFDVRMVDRDDANNITYQQPGGTFFPFFVPTPPFEDAVGIRAMITKGIISPKFAAAVLMVDLQNPIFSEPRKSLLQYVDRLGSDDAAFHLDQKDVPRNFMAIVTSVAQGQPACPPNDVSRCTPE